MKGDPILATERRIPDTVLAYWRHVTTRGGQPRTVWAVVHQPGSTQPPGYIQGWSVNKRQAAQLADRIDGVTVLVPLRPAVRALIED